MIGQLPLCSGLAGVCAESCCDGLCPVVFSSVLSVLLFRVACTRFVSRRFLLCDIALVLDHFVLSHAASCFVVSFV